jgi:hypothetical protein
MKNLVAVMSKILAIGALAVPVFASEEPFGVVTPEPSSLVLIAGVGVGLAVVHKLRNKSK